MKDAHHYCRRAHAIRRLAERYNLRVSADEYEVFAHAAQRAPQIHGTNIVKIPLKNQLVYCTIRRGEVATFLTPEQANRTIQTIKEQRLVRQKPITSLGDIFSCINLPTSQ